MYSCAGGNKRCQQVCFINSWNSKPALVLSALKLWPYCGFRGLSNFLRHWFTSADRVVSGLCSVRATASFSGCSHTAAQSLRAESSLLVPRLLCEYSRWRKLQPTHRHTDTGLYTVVLLLYHELTVFLLYLSHHLSDRNRQMRSHTHTVRRQAWQALCGADRDHASRLSGVWRDLSESGWPPG